VCLNVDSVISAIKIRQYLIKGVRSSG